MSPLRPPAWFDYVFVYGFIAIAVVLLAIGTIRGMRR
jgi:hypothetical protein